MDLWDVADRLNNTGICRIDRDGTIERCNVALASLLGRDTTTLVGESILELTSKDDKAETKKRFDAMKSGETDHVSTEKFFVRPGGERVLAHIESLAYRAETGELDFILSVASPLHEVAGDDKIAELEKSLQDMRMIVQTLSNGVTVNMTGGNSVNADNGSTASQDNSTTNSGKVMIAGLAGMGLVLVAFLVLVLGGKLHIGTKTKHFEVEGPGVISAGEE